MVVLVNRKRHIFALGDTEVYCGMGSDTVSYWLQRRDRGARWTVLVRNEGERAREELETLDADEVRPYVDDELGLALSDEDWADMGWGEELAARAQANVPPLPPPPARPAAPPLTPEEMEEEARLENLSFGDMIPGNAPWLLRMKAAAKAKEEEEERQRRK
jgi:hypothetical protein